MEIHSQNGMSVLLQEGDIADMNMLPRDFPTCGSFDWSEREFRRRESHPVSPMIEGKIFHRTVLSSRGTLDVHLLGVSYIQLHSGEDLPSGFLWVLVFPLAL